MTAPPSQGVVLPNTSLSKFFKFFQDDSCGGADMAEPVVLLACPLRLVPLATRGLAAMLARTNPAGTVVNGQEAMTPGGANYELAGSKLSQPPYASTDRSPAPTLSLGRCAVQCRNC
jgi:hypothetical protein